MKKLIYFIILCLCFTNTACAQKQCKYNLYDLAIANGKWIEKLTRKLANGIGCDHYYSGELLIEMPLKNGKIEGVKKEYYKNGKLREETPYKNGELHGICKLYYKNGNMMKKVPYKNNLINGFAKEYSEKGELLSKILYKNGEVRFYNMEQDCCK